VNIADNEKGGRLAHFKIKKAATKITWSQLLCYPNLNVDGMNEQTRSEDPNTDNN